MTPLKRREVRVLLSEGSILSSREALFALGLAGYEIEVCDPDSLCLDRFSRFVRGVHRSPKFGRDPAAYLAFVLDLLARRPFDVLLPVHEQVLLFGRVRERIPPNIGLAVPTFDAVSTLFDKAAFARLLTDLGLPLPATSFLHTREELEGVDSFPCYVKTALGTASRGVWRVADRASLAAVVATLDGQGLLDGSATILIQGVAPGNLEAAQTLFDRGRLVAFHAYQSVFQGTGGGLVIREGVLRPQVREHMEAIGGTLAWHGSLNVDYLMDLEGRLAYIDANPRLVEPMNACFSGVNLPDLLVRLSLGEHLEPLEGKAGVRTRQSLLGLLTAADRGRVAVLLEAARTATGRGAYRGSREGLTPVLRDPLSILPLLLVLVRLLLDPRSAEGMSDRTVDSYAATPTAVARIAAMPPTSDATFPPSR